MLEDFSFFFNLIKEMNQIGFFIWKQAYQSHKEKKKKKENLVQKGTAFFFFSNFVILLM